MSRLALALALGFAPSAFAHHSTALVYHRDGPIIEAEGVITEVAWVNPHVRFEMRGAGADMTYTLLRVTRNASRPVEVVSLDDVKFATAPISNPSPNPGNARARTITDIAYADGQVWVAGLSNEQFASAFRRIDEDNRFHYLLTYSPRNTEFDGKFRAIRVRVGRPGTDVFARKGYRAIRTPSGLDAGTAGRPPRTSARGPDCPSEKRARWRRRS